MSYQITALKALQDNYIWIIHDATHAIVVDPTLAAPVSKFIWGNQLRLSAILLTHGHHDHTGGVDELVTEFNPEVIDNFNNGLDDGQEITIAAFPQIKVILTPGHVFEHVCYLFDGKHLFCGDTLFALGCGRVFTGDYLAMYHSLCKLKKLDPAVKCYPAHEYTLNNLKFTLAFDNNHAYYSEYANLVNSNLQLRGNSLPTTIGLELKYNLLLRNDDRYLWQILYEKYQIVVNDEFSCFKEIRLIRNSF